MENTNKVTPTPDQHKGQNGCSACGRISPTSAPNPISTNGNGTTPHCQQSAPAVPLATSNSNNASKFNTNPARSSQPETEDEEPEDEYCVYTYKGDSRAAADLPSSFYKFDSSDRTHPPSSFVSANGSNTNDSSDSAGASGPGSARNFSTGPSGSRIFPLNSSGVQLISSGNGIVVAAPVAGPLDADAFSPDMDFLEMDFDPGGPGDDDESSNADSSHEADLEDEVELLNRERNLFSNQLIQSANPTANAVSTSTSPGNSHRIPLPRSPGNSIPGDIGSPDIGEQPSAGAAALDLTDGGQPGINRTSPGHLRVSAAAHATSTPEIAMTSASAANLTQSIDPKRSPTPSTSAAAAGPSTARNVESRFQPQPQPQPKPCSSKMLKMDAPSTRNNGDVVGSLKMDILGLGNEGPCSSCHCAANNSKKYSVKSRLLGSSGAATNQFSLRLVKSNTLPEMGRNLRRDRSDPASPSSAVTSPSANSQFLSVRTSGMSFSVPTIKDEPHFRAVINTSTSSSSSSKTPEDYSVELEVGSVMIWTIEDAYARGINQIGISACGATAVCNVLSALGFEDFKADLVNKSVGTRTRAELADLPEYLFSRSIAGATHTDLIDGILKITEGSVGARFFQPRPDISAETFSKWLLHWICKGAVPVLTRNLQISSEPSPPQFIPDAWHHQMVFGVSPGVLYFSNPIECVQVDELLPQLTSPSVLLIRRNDIICRKTPRTDLRLLARHPDPRWNQMNVLGQVANVILEESPLVLAQPESRRVTTSHVKIPAAYKGGVTLFMLQTSPSYSLLMNAPEI